MIRFLLIVTFIFLFFTIGSVLLFVLFLIGKVDTHKKDMASLYIVKGILCVVRWLAGVRLEVYGEENIPKDEAVLFIGNHRSLFDPVIGYSFIKRPTGFLAKTEVKKVPIMKYWMNRVHCLFMDRNDIKQSLKTILEGIDQINSGISLWVYPEGTRQKNKSLEPLEFKEGTFKLADKTKCRIVPVAMIGTDDIFENHRPFVRRSKVRVNIGKSFRIEDIPQENRRKAGVYSRDVIISLLNEMVEKNM